MTLKNGILITGAAQRVGAALALHFARHGHDVALHYNRSEPAARKIQQEIEAIGVACHLVRHDMHDIKGIPAFLREVKKIMPHCSTLINNASIFERAPLMETDEALFDRQMEVNFKAPFFMTQAFANTFSEGCIINMIDSEIVQSQGSHFAYLLSKKALAAFTEMAARELGPRFRVNGICPGILLPSNDLDMAYIQNLSRKLPLGHIASIEQVAETALFLCKGRSTGQLIYTDGGQHLL
jgi:NAD(P)-dependent dehydrogenase (short-subunit alcohol dehydrogenase family)